MPQLWPELQRLQPRLLLLNLFHGSGTLRPKAAALRMVAVRLIDKAVYEYSLARQAIVEQIAESQRPYEEMSQGRVIHMFGFTDHMENCLNATRRLLSLFESPRSDRSAPTQDRIKRRLVDAHAGSLVDIRNILEHMADAVNADEVGKGNPVVLSLGDDERSVVVGPYSIAFESLATILQAFHDETER